MKNVFPKWLSFVAPLAMRLDDGAGGAGGGAGGSGGGGAGGGGAAGGAGGGSPPPVTDIRTFLDEKGNITKPDEFWKAMEAPHLAKRFTNLGASAKSYVSLERMNSNSNKIAVPGDTATAEEWDAFYKGLGRPDSEDKYEMTVPDELKGHTLDEAALKEFRSTAFKNGLNGKQVKALTDFYFKSTGAALQAHEQRTTAAKEASVNALKKEWGTSYDANMALAKAGAKAAGLSDEALADPSIANNPHFIRAMHKVATMVKEQPGAGVRGGAGNLGGDIKGQISAIMGDPKHPYWIKGHPQHAEAITKVQGLYEQLHAAAP